MNRLPWGWPPSGHIWCFQLLLISNVISQHGLPDRGIDLSSGFDVGGSKVRACGRVPLFGCIMDIPSSNAEEPPIL
jgi:hypothetical protein